ncbi:MAG TPA: hypothetical protein PLC42_00945, partial [Parachlamydiaceae bacterium]|nr:hypothetical protein [Parachlamydiaceae bacterium]
KVLSLNKPELVISSDKLTFSELQSNHFFGLLDLKAKAYVPWKNMDLKASLFSQARVIASPIAFIGKVFKTVPYAHEDAPILGVSSFLFD